MKGKPASFTYSFVKPIPITKPKANIIVDTPPKLELPKPLREIDFTPYPHQETALQAHFQALEQGVTSQVFHMATGTGKTKTFCYISSYYKKSLFLVHTLDLLDQSVQAIRESIKSTQDDDSSLFPEQVRVGIIQGSNFDIDAPYVVATVQTLINKLSSIPPDTFDLVCMDECHHAASKTFKKVLEHFNAIKIGLTATPERFDGASLADLFDRVVYTFDIEDAVEAGALVKPVGKKIHTHTDIDEVKSSGGDLNQEQLARVLNTDDRNAVVVDGYKSHGEGRKAIFFCVDIQHAKDLAQAFIDEGVRANFISGNCANRFEKLEAFKTNEFDVICNAQLLTEGVDIPEVSVIGLAKPTKSRTAFIQMVGRGLRLAPNKSDCIILHYTDVTTKHALVDDFNFYGNGEVAEVTTNKRKRKEKEEGEDLLSWLEELLDTEFDATYSYEIDQLRPAPAANFSWSSALWHKDEATEAQLQLLARHGFDINEQDWTKGDAAKVIGDLPATKNQIKTLVALGFDALSKPITRNMASLMFEEAKEEGLQPSWRLVKELQRKGAFKRLNDE